MRTVLISGLGLIGSSIARIIKQADSTIQIIGVDPDDRSVDFLMAQLVIDQRRSFAEAAPLADLIVLAGPVSVIIEQINELVSLSLKPDVLVTDVGSSKVKIMAAATHLSARQVAFVGGHPMAGSDKVGSRFGRVDLFSGAAYFLVAQSQTDTQLNQFKRLMAPANVNWQMIDAKAHDHLVSELSHVPHIVATTLVNTVAKSLENNPLGLKVAAGGFKDTTRIAGASPEMWTAVALSNADEITRDLDQFKNQLSELQAAIKRGDRQRVFEIFEAASKIRKSLNH
ncbi:prephenate dehydrogenase [Lentilactobacillus fungorum]|uniref:Prephenate dehydrogenase n=1 Tax=Lentilactobacillus fungorum TaxID=2201250 RepID=A0ABQ3VZ46_9LACO|nr:prephenate dehydrogenase/arogenate dehydrogenase family protein [Lentilactobacillus fungorum]GHP14182.1 prephenate dehydrogenase [Lentilactobacillus fungorum]